MVLAGWSKPISEITNLLSRKPTRASSAPRASSSSTCRAPARRRGAQPAQRPGRRGLHRPGLAVCRARQGEKLRAIYDVYPQNVFNVVSLKSRNISKPADLKGKRVGVYSLSSGTRQNLQVLLHSAGLSEADITLVPTGLLNFAPLMRGQVDATAATDTGLLVGRQRGLGEVNVMEVSQYLNLSSDLLVVREETYQRQKSCCAASWPPSATARGG